MKRKIAVFTGTRADYGLLYWLMKEIQQDSDCELSLLVSGSHLSPEFGLTYREIENDGFVIDEKVEILLSSDTAVGVAKSIGLGVLGFSDALSRMNPDVLVVLGDRYEALAVAQTAMILRIPILHIHGGEITEGAYDDAIRHAISKLSHLHCVSTEVYRQRVIQLGESPDRVFNVGAVGLDHLERTELYTLDELSESLGYRLKKPYFLVTYHPVTLAKEDVCASFKAITDSLNCFPGHQVILTYSNADDGGRKIIPMLEAYAAADPARVLAIESLGQKRYLSAVKHASVVVGNSSSGVIEVPTFGVPTVNVGDRQKGRLAAKTVINTKAEKNSIVEAIRYCLSEKFSEDNQDVVNPYGQGDASSKILDLLKSAELGQMKSFYDLTGVKS